MKALTGGERGFLLLTSCLGDPSRKPLTVAQFRELTHRAKLMTDDDVSRELNESDLTALGYSGEFARHILELLNEEDLLSCYLHSARQHGCTPVTRASQAYPLILRKRLGEDAPGVLWAKGDLQLLNTPAIALVGSRDLKDANRYFAGEVGIQAAKQGLTLVSGNARGADQEAQNACLAAGGRVISIVADALASHSYQENVLYLSEGGFEEGFTSQRALSRNRCIHALGRMVFVAQAALGKGGTWDGTVKNLRYGWSSVACFQDGSEASLELEQMGAFLVQAEDLFDLKDLAQKDCNFLDMTESCFVGG